MKSVWLNGNIWRHRSWWTLAQIVACCLTALSHYLNQYWLIIAKVQCHRSESNPQTPIIIINFEITHLKFHYNLPELMSKDQWRIIVSAMRLWIGLESVKCSNEIYGSMCKIFARSHYCVLLDYQEQVFSWTNVNSVHGRTYYVPCLNSWTKWVENMSIKESHLDI